MFHCYGRFVAELWNKQALQRQYHDWDNATTVRQAIFPMMTALEA
jgi:hypothetical protein